MSRLRLSEEQARFISDVLASELQAKLDDFVKTVTAGDGFLAWVFYVLDGRPLVLDSQLSFHWQESNFDASENECILNTATKLGDLMVELGLREAEVGVVATPGTRVRPSGLAERLLAS